MATESNVRSKLEYKHYVCFPDDGQRHEIIDGEHFVNPAPSTYHQKVSRRIQFQLYTKIELMKLGEVIDAPVDLQLSDYDIVQPDLVVVLDAKTQIITPTKIKGVPQLVVEILSPTSDKNDRTLKKGLYERSGVPEYWIVDPFDHVLEQWVLEKGVYVQREHDDEVRLTIIDGVSVRLAEVW
jgi:Uma2 family endonuclease